MSPQPVPLPQTVDERLAFAAHHRGVATLGPEQAAALLLRLAELEAIVQRARAVLHGPSLAANGDPISAALYILGEDG